MFAKATIPRKSRRQFLSYVGAMSGAALLSACTADMLTIKVPAEEIQSSEGETPMAVKNVVLVHGAWADGSCWNGVISLLQEQGYNVTAVQNPLSSIADDVATTRRVLAMQDGPTVLVGHSYGGVVISELGEDAPNVVGLVYVAAFALDEGQTVGGLLEGATPPAFAHLHPDNAGYLWFAPEGYVQYFAADLDPALASVYAATQKPVNSAGFATPMGVPSWRSLPSWYMVAEDDQIIAPQGQQAMAGHIGATVSSIPSSHVLMISHPQEVADLIVTVTEAVAVPA
jgi:pimeloyl-ACP methyl ester carboxylesterase